MINRQEGRLNDHWIPTSFNLCGLVSDRIASRLKRTEEFRTRSATSRTPHLESMSGAETAAVLLNLKNHIDPRACYELGVGRVGA
jgi:hypothetical protein